MKQGFISLMLVCACAVPCVAQRYDNYCPPGNKVAFTQSTLPIVKIDVDGNTIQRRSAIDARLTIINNGEGHTNYCDAAGQTAVYDGAATIKYIGNSTFTASDKKSYLLQAGDRVWELKADGADRSMVRNMLARELASQFVDKVPSSQLCEVTIDGVYYGIYHLSQSITSLLDSGDILVSVDRNDVLHNYSSAVHPVKTDGSVVNEATVRYHYVSPDANDADARAKADAHISSMEEALMGQNYAGAIDVASFADYLLTSEFAHNADSYRLHALICFPAEGGATMILGDASLGFGNYDAFESFRSDTWTYNCNDIFAAQDEPQLVPFYWYNLIHDASFQSVLKERWAAYRTEVYTAANISAIIDRYVALLKSSGAIERNEQAWSVWSRRLWPNYYMSTSIDDEARYLKEWISERLAWMDAHVGDESVVEPVDPSARTEITPVAIASGFNSDCVAETRNAAPTDKNMHPALDGHGSVLIPSSMALSGKGIPDDGLLTADNGHQFRFGAYDTDNCLYLDRTGAQGTLVFAEPVMADSLCVLLVGTNRENYELKYIATVNYADGTSEQTDPQLVSDWCVEAYDDFVYRNLSRWRSDYNGGAIDGTRVNLSENMFKVNSSKPVRSVTFLSQCQLDEWGYGMLGIFAVSAARRITSGIDDIAATSHDRTIKAIWTLDGSLSTSLRPGINLVLYSDGTTKKIFVK